MRRLIHATRFGITPLLSLVLFVPAATALGDTFFSNTASISIPATTGGGSLPVTSSPYPSQITVSGMVGTLTDVAVTLNGWTDNGTSANPGDLYFLLTGPGGQAFEFMGDVGSDNPITNVTLTLTDSASAVLTSGGITSGSFKPTVLGGPACAAFPAPAPSPGTDCAGPRGTSTFFDLFDDSGLDPDGTWSLYIIDNTPGDTASTISRGWSVEVESTGGYVAPPPPSVPEPSSLALVGLAMGVVALRRVWCPNRRDGWGSIPI